LPLISNPPFRIGPPVACPFSRELEYTSNTFFPAPSLCRVRIVRKPQPALPQSFLIRHRVRRNRGAQETGTFLSDPRAPRFTAPSPSVSRSGRIGPSLPTSHPNQISCQACVLVAGQSSPSFPAKQRPQPLPLVDNGYSVAPIGKAAPAQYQQKSSTRMIKLDQASFPDLRSAPALCVLIVLRFFHALSPCVPASRPSSITLDYGCT